MFFTEDDNLRELEYLMKGVPNFKPRGHGIMVVCGLEYMPMYETRKQLIVWATQNIRHPLFRERLNDYLLERGEYVMDFVSKRHKDTFERKIRKVNPQNYKMIAAVYLLTANFKLQKVSYKHIHNDGIVFNQINKRQLSDIGYTLFCAAKDLYFGTKYITVSDLCDKQLIYPEMFGLICNAMGIKRFGIKAIKNERGETN